MQPGILFPPGLKGAMKLETLYILYPSDEAGYLHMLEKVGPALDDAGISFHICRPGEDIPGEILHGKEVNV